MTGLALDYDTDSRTISQIDRAETLASLSVAFSTFWNQKQAPEIDDLEALFEDVADQYASMARYEAGEYWEDESAINKKADIYLCARTILGNVDGGFAEKHEDIEGQARAVQIVREFLNNA